MFMKNAKDLYAPYKINEPLEKELLPQPIFDENPQLVDLYWKAWDLAWDHVLYREDVPQKKYIDESLRPDKIWIWDTCFMALFCRYAPDIFPGIESLNNFYFVMHDGKKLPFKIHHPDNPPLFAWVEWEYYKLTGDKKRLKWILVENQYLQKHYDYIENAKTNKIYNYAGVWIAVKKTEFGYKWSGIQSGMDNTPRGRGKYGKILWVDLLAQQALSAKYICKIAEVLQEKEIITEFSKKYQDAKNLLNDFYWNEDDGFYFDVKVKKPKKHVKVKTPAAFWVLLADVSNEKQAKRMVEHVKDLNDLGGMNPFPSVSRDDKDFDPRGQYWRGGIWMPTSYMSIKALERYGFYDLADELAERTVKHILKTYKDFEPHTIWEAFSPTEYKPATYKGNKKFSREDFCGWSALGPISLFIENILGFHEIDANGKTVKWDIHRKSRHGIKNLKFGEIIVDLIYEEGIVEINSNETFNLILNGKSYKIEIGNQKINLNI